MGKTYKIAFSIVCTLFVVFLVAGLYFLLAYDDMEQIWGILGLFSAVLSIPFAFIIGKRAFQKKTGE